MFTIAQQYFRLAGSIGYRHANLLRVVISSCCTSILLLHRRAYWRLQVTRILYIVQHANLRWVQCHIYPSSGAR